MAELKRLLIAEDDTRTREGWRELISNWGFKVEAAADGEQALRLIESFEPDILLLDLKLPRIDGLGVLRRIHGQGLPMVTLLASGEGDIRDAVSAIKLGAHDYLCKPVEIARLKDILRNLSLAPAPGQEGRPLSRAHLPSTRGASLLGNSPAIRKLSALIDRVAASDAAVMIVGESGTGKEMVARAIHERSTRREGPYVAVNCAALPETLMESELFGHEKGAFTGAERRRMGCFELASRGTLLLDEITEMKIDLQAKLLRVIEEATLRRVGGTANIPFDVRIVASSNRDLARAISESRLREDLYYRLNVFTIQLPPLRERAEDIGILAESFTREFAAATGKEIGGLDDRCLALLRAHSWPGNVRQLRNVIKRAVVLASNPVLTSEDLPAELGAEPARAVGAQAQRWRSLDEVERDLIFSTLDAVAGNKPRAAEILGISLKTLYNRLDRYCGRDRAKLAPAFK